MKKYLYHTLAGIMALAAAANYLTPGASVISADAMPVNTPAVTECDRKGGADATGTECHGSSWDCYETKPVIRYDSWQDVHQDGHFRFASESSDYSECVVREVLDDEKAVRIPQTFEATNTDRHHISGNVVGVEYDGSAVKAGEGVRQRELMLDTNVSWLTLYDFSANDAAEDNPENYYDLFTSLIILNPKCSIDIPQIDTIVKLLHKNGLELTIRGLEGSTAEKYSKDHGLPFENALLTDGVKDSVFTYCLHGDYASVYKWEDPEAAGTSWDKTKLTIPSEINGLPVREIDDNAFNSEHSICAVTLPDTVTRIGKNAFARCYSLTSIQLSSALRQIESDAFNGTKLESVEIPEGVTRIGDRAFQSTNLQSIVIPDSVTELGKGVFMNCDHLASAKLPDGLEKIPDELFYSAGLSKITIPDSVTEIGSEALGFCSELEEAVLPEHLTVIGDSAFKYCNFSAITIPESVLEIGTEAFYNCKNLKSMTIPKGVTGIPTSTFEKCTALERVELPEGLRAISESAFSECGLLTLDIPDSVKSIGPKAFEECLKLKSVRLPKNLKKLPDSIFFRCLELETVQFPENLKAINDSAFFWTALETVDLPDTVTEIGWGAFLSCASLKKIHLPENLTAIPEAMFSGCKALESIEIPASVKLFGSGAFNTCESLSSVTFLTTDCTFNITPFGKDRPNNPTIIGYAGSTAQEAAKEYSLPFKTLDGSEPVAPDPANMLEFEVREDGAWLTALKVGMDEVTVPAEYEGHPVVGVGKNAFHEHHVKQLVLPDTITDIESQAFESCQLESIILPKNLKTIGSNAFASNRMKSVVIPDGVTVIFFSAFSDCPLLIDVTFPAGLKEIQSDAFYNCGLTSVSLPASVSWIGRDAFADCLKLTALTIPNGSCQIDDILNSFVISRKVEQEEAVPTLYGVKDSAVHSYADFLGIPFCTLDGTPVTEHAAAEFQPVGKTEPVYSTEIYSAVETTAAYTTSALTKQHTGDINLSGTLTISDAILLARVLAEDAAAEVTSEGLYNADMNGSGTPDQEDLTQILKMIAGIKA